jgi:hypothetical protein
MMLATLAPTGELATPDEAFEIQQRTKALYFPSFHSWPLFFARYHLVGALKRRPRVLVFGSSRVKTLRSDFFREPERQFNAGIPGTDNAVGSWRRFLLALPPDGLPSTIFINLDPWRFGAATVVQPEPDFLRRYSRLEILDFAWRKGFWWSVDQVRTRPAPVPGFLGVEAQRERSGLRPDGSLFKPRRAPDESLEDVQRNLDAGQAPFFQGEPRLSQPALDELKRFLDLCAEHRIKVIGYVSSLKPAYYAAMKSDPRFAYSWLVAPALAPLFEQTHHELFDFLDPAKLGCDDGQFLDSMHESEVCTVRLLLAMAKESETVASLVDARELQTLLDHRRSAWELDR